MYEARTRRAFPNVPNKQFARWRHLVLLSCALWPLTLRAQDPLRSLPRNYRIEFENAWIRVVHVRYGARESLPVHDHSRRPTVYVYLTDSPPVRFAHVEAQPFAMTRPPVTAGTFRVSPGRREVHTVENLGDTPSEFLRVELKRVPLGVASLHVRGVKPFDLTRSTTTVEFTHPQMAIERVICVAEQTCTVSGVPDPSLLIALSPVGLETAATAAIVGVSGTLHWVPQHASLHVRAVGAIPVHLLRIRFPGPPIRR